MLSQAQNYPIQVARVEQTRVTFVPVLRWFLLPAISTSEHLSYWHRNQTGRNHCGLDLIMKILREIAAGNKETWTEILAQQIHKVTHV